jgi:hypothetical protein
VPAAVTAVIEADIWAAACDQASVAGHPTAIALDVDYGGDGATVAAATLRPDGKTHVEIVVTGPDIEAAIQAAATLQRKYGVTVTVDPGGPLRQAMPDVKRHRIVTQGVPMRDVAAGAAAFVAAVTAGTVVHIGQEPLTEAVRTAATRPLADGWTWARQRSAGPISPLTAVTLAWHAARTPRAKAAMVTR